MRAFFALLLAVTPAIAEDYDPIEVLMRLRDQVLAAGERIPNHTCVETITRERYDSTRPPAPKTCDALLARRQTPSFPTMLRHVTTDRLRLDVAMADNREIYSWAGASRFEQGEIDELIPDGAMGTGPFAAMLLGVFKGRVPRFTYEEMNALEHRMVFRVSFKVPLEESRFRVKAGQEWVFTGYSGTLWVDVKTAELVRLVFRTDELSPATGMCETQTTLDYGTVKLAGGEYLLPKMTRQRFISRDGSEAENHVTFASCREYKGESTVRFGDSITDAPDASAPRPAPLASFPPGLPVTIDLASTVHSTRAAAGDVIRGYLAKPIGTVVPAGAPLLGRIMRVEVRHGSRPEVVIALRWETIEVDGTRAPIALRPDRRMKDLRIGDRVGLNRRGVEIELPSPSDSLHGVYHFPGQQAVVEAGYRTEWTTVR